MAGKGIEKRGGFVGKILRVNLTTSEICEDELSDDLKSQYIGGAGINAKLLFDNLREKMEINPLSPDNPLIFGAGPLVGTKFPCATRYTVTSKSPLTGLFGDSNAGGHFGVKMKQAGFDHIIIEGKAEFPSLLLIEKGKKPQIIEVHDIWGMDTYETDEYIEKRFGSDFESARIGPAGENLVRYASIFSGRKRVSANGRAGMGCVMGSKKLKAVLVKGDGIIPSADEVKFDSLVREYSKLWSESPAVAANSEYGTLILIAQLGTEVAKKNDQGRISEEELSKYDITEFAEKYKAGKSSCFFCPVGCSQKWKVNEGKYRGEEGDKIEFGHYVNLGPLLDIYDFPTLFHLANLTNRMGLDVTQFGWNLAMAMECYQRGIIGQEDTGGFHLNWGDADLVEDMIMKVSKREGFGNLLAESIPEIIRQLGSRTSPYGFHTKGMTFPYNRKQVLPMGLASSVATRGADHMKGHPYSALVGAKDMLARIFGKDSPEEIANPLSPVAKGRVVWWHENFKMAIDSLGLCFIPVAATNIFGNPLILFNELYEIYEAATGVKDINLFHSAERAYQLEKGFNCLLGIKRDDDMRKGTTRGEEDPIEHPGMLDEYYFYRGYSKEGLPCRKRLEEIGFGELMELLEENGKLVEDDVFSIKDFVSK
ncbi:MAG: hypothetical protein D6734_00390 [Candidatus Schekmanbacteria bacterium]|nr:MAG: hypothetical protein D6734_00390 [Candidatus Schekmanbacteria bacterium]